MTASQRMAVSTPNPTTKMIPISAITIAYVRFDRCGRGW